MEEFLATQAAWREEIERHKERIEQALNDEAAGDLTLVSLYLMSDPATGEPHSKPEEFVVATTFVGPSLEEVAKGKQHFHFLMTALALAGDAVASVWVSEVWAAVYKENGPYADLAPSQRPDREDAAAIYADHRLLGQQGFVARIKGEKPDRALSVWDESLNFRPSLGSYLPDEALIKKARSVPILKESARVVLRQAGILGGQGGS